MAKTISELRNQSIQVRDASAAGENTATRVGTVLNDIVGHIEDYENTQSSNNSSQDAKIEGVKSSLNSEIARAKTEESNLSTQIGTERTERQAAVSREETARIQADNDEKTARMAADNAEQDARIKADNDEKTARENADITLRTMIQTEVSDRQVAVKQEEIRAMAAEKANTQAIEDETARATTAEAAETARATTEEERLQGEIDNTNTSVETLDDKVNSNHDHLTDEVARLDTTDNEIKADFEAETARATAAEQANAQAIETNAQAIETNAQAIVAEKNRAKAAEEANAQAIAEEKAAIMGTDRISDGAVTLDKIAHESVDDEPTAGSDNLVKSGGVADKISELEIEINGVEYSKSYSYNVGNRPSSSVAANPVIVDFKAPCTIEFGVKDVSFPDDIVNITLYLRDADGNAMNGNGTTLNNNNLIKFDAVKDIKYITMYSNNLFLKACSMTIVAKKVGDGLKQKIESLEKDLADMPINDIGDEVRNLTLNTVGKYDFNINWVSGKYINKEGKLVDISASIYGTEKYYRVNPNDVIFTNCICYGDTCVAFYNSDKQFVEYIQQTSASNNVIHVPDNDEIKYARFTHRVDTVQIVDVYCYKKKDNNMQAEIDRVYAMSTNKQPSAKIINFDKFSGDGWSVLENKISATTTSNNSLSYPVSWAEQDSVFAVNAVVEGSTFEFVFGKYAISTDAGTKVYGSMFGVRKTASGDYLVTYQGDWEERNVLPLDNVKLTPGALITISVREYISERFAGRVFDITLVDNNGNKDIVTNVGSSYPYINGKPLFDKGHKISTTGQNCGYPIFKMISGSMLTIRNFSFSFPKGNDTKLLICGHSYVEGNSLQGQGDQINCFASQIKKELPTSQVLGWGGDDFTRFETYYRTLLDWFPKAEYMLICLGGNDKYNGVKAYSTTEGQNWLINKIKAVNETLKSYNVIPIWFTINPLKLEGFSEPTIVNNYIKSNVLSVDVVDLFYKDGSFVEGAFLPDNVHPTKEVHAKILERIKEQASYLFLDA